MRMEFEVLKEIAVLREGKNGWRKEVNLVSWNGKEPKYDIRWWPPDRSCVGKGLTLLPEEIFQLGEVIVLLPKDLHLTFQTLP